MKKKELCFFSIFFLLFLLMVTAEGAELNITATAAAVVDVETGQVLYGKNIHLKRQPASLTKILTAIIAIEEGNLADQVTVSYKATCQEGSSIYLEAGEKLALEELIYGAMLASGNDASVAIAEHISGSVDKFARLMNEKAKKMGAKNSNFINPSGLPHYEHYSTAYDLAMIMRYAIRNETFARITATKNKTISWANNDWGRGLRNHNKLLWSYQDITGGKTGYTKAAGRCLIASAKKDGREVVAVVLNSNNDWLEVRTLLDYGFDNYKRVIISEKGEIIHQIEWQDSREGELGFLTEEPIYILIPKNEKIKIRKEIVLQSQLQLPIKMGDIIGNYYIYQDDNLLGESRLVAANDLQYNSLFLRFYHWILSIIQKI